jgi:hypothetical protein
MVLASTHVNDFIGPSFGELIITCVTSFQNEFLRLARKAPETKYFRKSIVDVFGDLPFMQGGILYHRLYDELEAEKLKTFL